MTSEVALLNRSAVALAADSAATVRRWEHNQYVNYYFKGTNKIFQLSGSHPVGCMIYATASLQGAPWDMLIKCYRDHRAGKPHDYLKGYADDLFDYISSNTHIFGADVQEDQFKTDVDIVAARLVNKIRDNTSVKGEVDATAKKAAAISLFAKEEQKISKAKFVGNADQTDLNGALAKYTPIISNMLEKDDWYKRCDGLLERGALARAAIQGQFKRGYTNLTSTGLVIAGFGDKEFFPHLLAYRCYGFVLGKLIVGEEATKHKNISQKDSSDFISFAQDEMIQTFAFGVSPKVLDDLDEIYRKSVKDLYAALVNAGLAADTLGDIAKEAALGKVLGKATDDFATSVVGKSYRDHTIPMRRVLSSLPFDELAELAHTLVLLESLKERVTSPTSSVSGPIDVAVISKNDGFIWIKRKHYFDPDLNPRYFANRGMKRSAP